MFRRASLILATVVVGSMGACAPLPEARPDDFPGRLKEGCSSEKECVKLVSDALDRWARCRDEHLVSGSRWARCNDRCADFVVARDKALAWFASARPGSVDPNDEDPSLRPRCM